jgi:hypothetical protein
MTTNDNAFLANISSDFYCDCCDYTTSRKYNYKIHLNSIKHLSKSTNNKNNGILAKTSKIYQCKNCDKLFNDRAGLWRHNKKNSCTEIIEEASDDKQLFMMLIKQQSELIKENSEIRKEHSDIKELILELVKNGTHNTTHMNSHNKAFNLNFFLNETCKNAMNITDFVDSIKPQLSDLIDVGELGYVEGISKLIVKSLNNSDETLRPIHCTDKKRETFYVKCQGQWEKENEDKKQITNVIKTIANKNIRLLPQFREKYPEYKNSSSKVSDKYDKMVIEVMETDAEKYEKIIKNISNATIILKNT